MLDGIVSAIKKGTLKLKKGEYAAGDVINVNAKLPGTGVQTNITLKVVEPTKNVKILKSTDKTPYTSNKTTLTLDTDEKLTLVTGVQKKNDTEWTVAGENDYAAVTYTVKGDCVQLVGSEVRAIKTGTATITAKTSDGKTAKLTVKVEEPSVTN